LDEILSSSSTLPVPSNNLSLDKGVFVEENWPLLREMKPIEGGWRFEVHQLYGKGGKQRGRHGCGIRMMMLMMMMMMMLLIMMMTMVVVVMMMLINDDDEEKDGEVVVLMCENGEGRVKGE